ncbi:helix-turn-helix transcriptional regulator [Kribbella sp.]|uniref:helix-turn-helix transcriptional regulator n=1 Tax=Kribbella sp. TaxID=1871183 RepID=UPI002D525CA1|nr:WYL domain-containing protein [Kribbella sp.]HZX03443.1 WYL domain-containing protein [Kribbella sp.]
MDTATRLLRLLSLLHSRPQWDGAELAARLEITPRTVRRDVTRLRSLGYPIDAEAGIGGGYRLGPGGRLPPLLLEDAEAVAIAVGLRVATTTTVSGVEEAAISTLAKLHQVLPVRLREQVDAIAAHTTQLPQGELPAVDGAVLVTLAAGCRHTEGIRFGYRTHDGTESERSVEPLQIVHTGKRWYLVARDRDRQAWRTFRVDRITRPELTGSRYHFDDPPDPAALVAEGTGVAPWDLVARLRVQAPADTVAKLIPPTQGIVEPLDATTCEVRFAANDLGPLVAQVTRIYWPFEILAPPGLREAVHEHARRLLEA